MYCKKCGKEIDNNSNFCCYCGEKVSLIPQEKDESKNELEEDIFEMEEMEELNDFSDEEKDLALSKNLEEMDFLPDNLNPETLEENTNKQEESVLLTDEDKECLNTKEIENLVNKTENTEPQKDNHFKKEEIISILLGAFSLVLAFFVNIFSLPMSISGLVFSSYSKEKYGKEYSRGKLINYGSMVVSIIMFIVCICGFFALLNTSIDELDKGYNIQPTSQYQYNLNENYNKEEDKEAEKNWQKAQELLNEKNNQKSKESSTTKKYTSIGFMEYEIPTSWEFKGIRNVGGDNTANIFTKNDAYILVKAMDLTGITFSKEALADEVRVAYGEIQDQGSFTSNNGINWDYLSTPTYQDGEKEYKNIIYYHISDDESKLFYFELYLPQNEETENLTTELKNILNSVKSL